MKKIIKNKIILIVILCIISCGIGVYAATTYKASDIVYNASDGTSINVNDALNDIYTIKTQGNATENDILNGKTAVVKGKMITGTFKNNFTFETIENPVGTSIMDYNEKRKDKYLTFTLGERLSYNDTNYSDYMCYIYPIDLTNVSTLILYQWNYISMHFTVAISLFDTPLYSRQEIIDNAFATWTYLTSGSKKASNYNIKEIDVRNVTGKKYINIAVVSKNNSSDEYYMLTKNIISFN